MVRIQGAELLCDSVIALISPGMWDAGTNAIQKIKSGVEMAKDYPNVNLWPSIYSAVDVIVNRTTPPHRDSSSCSTHYDLLVSVGTHTSSSLRLRELGVALSYAPGSLVCLCGRILMHEVDGWEGGERICFAHYMVDAVHDRLGSTRPLWPMHASYLALFGT
jgi:hypothetical protein